MHQHVEAEEGISEVAIERHRAYSHHTRLLHVRITRRWQLCGQCTPRKPVFQAVRRPRTRWTINQITDKANRTCDISPNKWRATGGSTAAIVVGFGRGGDGRAGSATLAI